MTTPAGRGSRPPNPYPGPHHKCRHCPAVLAKIEAGWVDERGFLVCMKATTQPPLLHEPMPADRKDRA